jgi:hypothetical protein
MHIQTCNVSRDAIAPASALLFQAEFDASVELGFQASATWQQGAIIASEAGAAGAPMSTVQNCSWAFKINPLTGWGDAAGGAVKSGKATAGWLSVLSVFEPHWQVRGSGLRKGIVPGPALVERRNGLGGLIARGSLQLRAAHQRARCRRQGGHGVAGTAAAVMGFRCKSPDTMSYCTWL